MKINQTTVETTVSDSMPNALKALNYRHVMLLDKLSEVDIRIFNIAKAIGGEFPLKECLKKDSNVNDVNDVNDNIVDVYSMLLQETNNKLESIFQILTILERLSVN